MKPGLLWVDNLRDFLILLVVVGHIIQFSHFHYGETLPFQFIYSFHMPLFVFISGFVSGVYMKWGGVRKRFIQLIIPYLMVTFLFTVEKGDVGYFLKYIVYPEKGLWFLWVLFL